MFGDRRYKLPSFKKECGAIGDLTPSTHAKSLENGAFSLDKFRFMPWYLFGSLIKWSSVGSR